MIQQIQAKQIASGDTIFLPRKKGKLRVERIAARYSAINKTAVVFDDGKTRIFDDAKNVVVNIADFIPCRRRRELYRFDLESGRVSVISESAFLSGFFEFSDCFEQKPSRVCSPLSSVLLDEIRRGATFYTNEAVYSRDRFKLPIECRFCGAPESEYIFDFCCDAAKNSARQSGTASVKEAA